MTPEPRKSTVQRARELRHRMTPQEKILWRHLRISWGKRFGDLKFRRQQPIDHYVVDFYCPEKRLIIELEGSIHDKKDQKEYDRERFDHLGNQGFQILRISNIEIERDIKTVLNKIKFALLKPSPLGGRGHGEPRG